MTATDSRETAIEEMGHVGPPPVPPTSGRRRSVGVRRSLAIVAVIVALASGFLVGQSSGSGSVQPPLVTPAQISTAAASAAADSVDDRGFSQLENGVQHVHVFDQAVDPATRAELARQMVLARSVAMQYPTLADAQRAGLRRAGPFSPGLGTHMIDFAGARYGAGRGPMNDDQIRHPLAWIYDGTKPNSPITGLFYSANVQDPAGFAGPNDVWHKHTHICITTSAAGVDAPLGADHEATKAQCDAVHGQLIVATGPLLHVWVVPGYEDSQGVFAHLNPAVTCNDGTYATVDVTKIGTRTSACSDGTE